MEPTFVRVNQAINFTLEYYSTGRIKDHIDRFAGELNLCYLDTHLEITETAQSQMEDEINQTVFTANQQTQDYLFSYLRRWLGDYRIARLNTALIEKKVIEYNEKTYAAFVQDVEEAVAKHQANPNFQRAHLEQYEEEMFSLGSMFGSRGGFKKVKRTNYKYYCIEKEPELIDEAYLPQYFELVEGIIARLKAIAEKHVNEYYRNKENNARYEMDNKKTSPATQRNRRGFLKSTRSGIVTAVITVLTTLGVAIINYYLNTDANIGTSITQQNKQDSGVQTNVGRQQNNNSGDVVNGPKIEQKVVPPPVIIKEQRKVTREDIKRINDAVLPTDELLVMYNAEDDEVNKYAIAIMNELSKLKVKFNTYITKDYEQIGRPHDKRFTIDRRPDTVPQLLLIIDPL
jgi:hypothetical protein